VPPDDLGGVLGAGQIEAAVPAGQQIDIAEERIFDGFVQPGIKLGKTGIEQPALR
jgi:hypothetical protein